MSYLAVKGGRSLSGELVIHGAKNSVLPILAATVLKDGKSILHNCPELRDVKSALKILNTLGCRTSVNGSDVEVDSSGIEVCRVDETLMREMRSSVTFLGAILARCGRAEMSLPGGCELGPRPVDIHISSLKRLGAEVDESGGKIVCVAKNMKGTEIHFPIPSVGATENIMLAATACNGTTRIVNAAREPEICDLQNYLIKCGFTVRGAGGSVIEVVGGRPDCVQTEHTIMPDRIETATYMAACAAAGGSIKLNGANIMHVGPIISLLSDAGMRVKAENGAICISMNKIPRGVGLIRTMPYPGFPTDAQAVLMAALARSAGTSIFIETIFENRFRHVDELVRMGADIKVEGRTAVLSGVKELYGASVVATDLRGGAALTVAALGAQGDSAIEGVEHIDRGYQRIEESLASLGADIHREI